jgi:hypothetical protein
MTKFEYIGPGHQIGIPARDLDDYDIARICSMRNLSEQELTDKLLAKNLYKSVSNFECEQCGKPYKSQPALIKHEMTHLPETEIEEEQDDVHRKNSI